MIWATREVRTDLESSVDSVTVVRIHLESGEERRVEVSGWYRLHDGDTDGSLLWSAEDPVARVVIVNVDDLIQLAMLH